MGTESHTGRIASDRILETLDAQGHSVLWLADRIGSSLEELAVELLMYDRLTVYTITRSARALHVPFESLLTRGKQNPATKPAVTYLPPITRTRMRESVHGLL